MKRIILALLSICLIFCVCGCSSKDTASTPSIETQYYNYAKECIEKEDTEKAKQVLEEGIEKTGSEKLKELLDSLSAEKKEDTSSTDTASNVSNSASTTESGGTQSVTDNSSSQTANSTNTSSDTSLNDICGCYVNGYTAYTVYKKDNAYKVLIKCGEYSGYFPMTDNGDGSYTVAASGIDTKKNYGNYESTTLDWILYAESVKLYPLTESSELKVVSVSSHNAMEPGLTSTEILRKDNSINVENFVETFE